MKGNEAVLYFVLISVFSGSSVAHFTRIVNAQLLLRATTQNIVLALISPRHSKHLVSSHIVSVADGEERNVGPQIPQLDRVVI